jgi:hypothetical protein
MGMICFVPRPPRNNLACQFCRPSFRHSILDTLYICSRDKRVRQIKEKENTYTKIKQIRDILKRLSGSLLKRHYINSCSLLFALIHFLNWIFFLSEFFSPFVPFFYDLIFMAKLDFRACFLSLQHQLLSLSSLNSLSCFIILVKYGSV